jgi:hypothetical protein
MRRLVILALGLTGCSAAYWGGEASGSSPGIHIRGPWAFGPASISATADTTAEAELIQWQKDDGFTARNIRFGQNAAAVVREEPAKIVAIAELQDSQGRYVESLGRAVKGVLEEIMPVLQVLALAKFRQTDSGWQATLPNGLSLGRTKSVKTPEELSAFFAKALEAVQKVQIPTTQPVTP